MRTYTVKKGDTLGAIARRFGFTLDEILGVNPQIHDPDRIRPGQVITIPHDDQGDDVTKVHYEVNNQGGEWLEEDQGDDGELVSPAGGIYGLAVSLEDAGVHVEYRVFADGKWSDTGKDGDRVEVNGKPVTAIRASLSPRRNRHIVYTLSWFNAAVNKQETVIGRDNVVVGSDAANAPTLLKLRVKIEKD